MDARKSQKKVTGASKLSHSQTVVCNHLAMLAKRFLPFVVIGLVCLSFGAQRNSDRKFWAKQYREINSMFNRKDTDAFKALLAPDFYEMDQNGKKLDHDTFIKTEVEPMKQATSVKSKVKVTNVSENGDDAQISYDWRYTIINPGTKTVGVEIGIDGWHRAGGKWLNTSTTVKSAREKTTKTAKK